ncbi:MAG TPA: YciI family protein, partial [Chryseolinea sp.]
MKTGLLFIITMLACSYVFGQSPGYIFVFLNKKADAEQLPNGEVEKLMDGHMANIERLANEGKLIAAGPFEGGGGIFIFNTNSLDEAKSWLDTDPGVRANRWDVEMFPYRPRVNSVCSAKAPYEMVTYQFIRFTANKSKSTARDYPQIFYKHDDFLKEVGKNAIVVTEGIFGE